VEHDVTAFFRNAISSMRCATLTADASVYSTAIEHQLRNALVIVQPPRIEIAWYYYVLDFSTTTSIGRLYSFSSMLSVACWLLLI